MVERRTNASQFAGVNAIAKRIEELTKERDELTKERQNSQTKLIEEHGVILAEVQTTLTLLVERTKNLPALTADVSKLKMWKSYLAGIASAFTLFGAFIGWAETSWFRR